MAILFIVLNELREWRTSNKFKELSIDIDVMDGKIYELDTSIDELNDSLDASSAISKSVAENLVEMNNSLHKAMGLIDESRAEAKEFIIKAQADLATIVNEYKINGIPLGYHRKPVEEIYDSVEGF